MPNLNNYPFKSTKIIDGKTYISVDELNEILDNLERLGPTFKEIADATQQLKSVFGNAKKTSDNLLVEMQNIQRNAEVSLGDNVVDRI